MRLNLAGLLRRTDLAMANFTNELELLSGHPSEDNRLLAEVSGSCLQRITELGLDPTDTTAKELYHSLQAFYERDSQHFTRAIGEQPTDGLTVRFSRLQKIMQTQPLGKSYSLKNAAIKKLLQQNPPRRLMKQLNYRSLDSMLKRENIRQLFLAAQQQESSRYLKLLHRSLGKLKLSDFESRPLEVLTFGTSKQSYLPGSNLITPSPLTGAVAVWPGKTAQRISTLGLILLVLQALEQIRSHGLALKFCALNSDFNDCLKAVGGDAVPALSLAGQPIFWRALSRHYGRQGNQAYQQIFETYSIDFNDFHPHDLTKAAGRLHSAISWWSGNDYLIYADQSGKSVSLNLVDVAINQAKGSGFAKRTLSEARRDLWDELISRYLAYPAVERAVQRQLDKNPALAEDISSETVNVKYAPSKQEAIRVH